MQTRTFSETYRAMNMEDKALWWGFFVTTFLTMVLPLAAFIYFFLKTILELLVY